MKELFIIIKGRPASKKNNPRIFKHGRITFRLPSLAFERFKEEALWQLKRYKQATPIGQCRITYDFFQKGKLKQDPDNAVASINDVLQEAGIIENDSEIIFGTWEIFRESEDWVTKIKIEYGF